MTQRFLSPTAINSYLRCPRKYYLKYIKRHKDKPNIHLFRGSAVHKALADFHNLHLASLKDIEDMRSSLLQIFAEEWERLAPQIDLLGLPKDRVDRFYSESLDMLRDWVARHAGSPSFGSESVRAELKLFSRTHGVMGIIDAVYGHRDQIALVDYKTSARDDITPDIKVQMALYALLFEDSHSVRPHMVIIDFLKTGRERRFRVSDGLIRYAKTLCTDMHQKTSSPDENDYPCTCGGWCEKDFASQNGGR